MSKCKEYLVVYQYSKELEDVQVDILNHKVTTTVTGNIDIVQEKYVPISSEVLDDARRIIREANNLPEDYPILILSWQRYEAESSKESFEESTKGSPSNTYIGYYAAGED